MEGQTKILVVEDESIVAKDIQNTLIRLGYDVPSTASSFPIAIQKLESLKPDLVFLDIKLKGDQDGIEIAEHIKKNFDIPVIFLTSYVDKATLDRAKITEPYGYIVKPFNENDLQSTVEMALYKFRKDKELRDSSQRYENVLQQIEEAIITTDTECRITFLNPKGESIIGYGTDSANGTELFKVLKIENEEINLLNADNLSKEITRKSTLSLDNVTITVLRDFSQFKATVTVSSVKDEKDTLIGYAFLITEKVVGKDAAPVVKKEETPEMPVASSLENTVIQNSFFVKKGSTLVKVYLDNINWIQAMDNYVIIQTSSDQFVIHATMKDIETKLPSEKFLRVHRSYIIPIDKINVLDENTIVIGDKTIPVGKSYKDAFLNRLNFL